MSGSEEDLQLRQRLKEKDMDFQEQLRGEMEREEENLKGYFKEFKKPIDKDPKKIRRSESAAVDRTMIFKQALKPFTLFSTFYQFWNMRCATPEQDYTLQVCKHHYASNMAKGVAASLLVTGFVSFRLRNVLTPALHLFGIATALMSGLIYGSISSTRFTLEQFEKLGDGYELGRIASSEIAKYRMDQPLNRTPA